MCQKLLFKDCRFEYYSRWKTTTVHRAELPYGQISGLSTSNAALAVNILLVSRDAQSDHILGPKIQSRLKGTRQINC